jgi:peptide/nickel transport system substrate-binding protein
MGDPTTRAAAIEIGDVDMAIVEPTDFIRLQDVAGLKGWLQSRKGWGDLSINLSNPILQDLRVRQAIAHAIDKEAINESPVFQELGEIKYCEFTEGIWGSDPSPKEEFGRYNLDYDPEQAMALLEEAGWKDTDGDGVREAHGVEGVEDGTKLQLLDLVRDYEKSSHEIIQGMLSEVGIKVEVRVHDFATRETLLFEGKFDIAPWPTTAQSFFAFNEEMHSESVPFYNIGFYGNPVVDALLDGALATTDPELQREYYRLVAIQVLKDLASIPTVKIRNTWILKAEVQGVKSDLMSVGFDLYDAWMGQ